MKNARQSAAWQVLRGKATVAQADELLAILRDVLLTVRLDNRERFRQMVLEEKASQRVRPGRPGPPGGPHPAAGGLQRGRLGERADRRRELPAVFLRQLAERVEADWPAVLEMLEEHPGGPDQPPGHGGQRHPAMRRTGAQVRPQLDGFAGGAAVQRRRQRQRWAWRGRIAPEGLVIPAQVNYVGKGANLYELGYQLHGSIMP